MTTNTASDVIYEKLCIQHNASVDGLAMKIVEEMKNKIITAVEESLSNAVNLIVDQLTFNHVEHLNSLNQASGQISSSLTSIQCMYPTVYRFDPYTTPSVSQNCCYVKRMNTLCTYKRHSYLCCPFNPDLES